MPKMYLKYRKKALAYMKKHPEYNALVHAFGGMSIGVLITSPLLNPHPVRWAIIFGLISVAGHLYTLVGKE